MGDLVTDAAPMGFSHEPINSPAQSPSHKTRPEPRVFNISGSTGVHIGPVIHHVNMKPKQPINLQDMPLKRDVEALLGCYREIEDRDKFIVCEHLGGCWKSLGRAMQFSSGQLENIEADNSRNADRVDELLSRWHDRESSRATVAKLSQFIIDVKAYHVLKYLKP